MIAQVYAKQWICDLNIICFNYLQDKNSINSVIKDQDCNWIIGVIHYHKVIKWKGIYTCRLIVL